MFKSKLFRRIAIFGSIVVLVGVSAGVYLFFKPHRDVQKEEAFATISARELTKAYTTDANKAKELYLSADGNSKILIVTGTISKISTNQAGEQIVLIKEMDEQVGVQATFLKTEAIGFNQLKPGDQISVKGAITPGNSYDADLDLYEHATLTQAAVVENPKQ